MSDPGPYHHGDLREALIGGAAEELRRRGAEAVSLRAVAAAAGVSPSAAYHHFPDKAALLVAVGERGEAEFDRRMDEAASSVPGTDDAAAVARLSALGRAYVGFALAEPHLFRHLFGALCANHHGSVPDGAPQASAAFGLLCAALDDLAARGLLRPGTRPGLELLAWSAVHGIAGLALEGLVPAEAVEALLATLLRVVLAGPAPDALAPEPSPPGRRVRYQTSPSRQPQVSSARGSSGAAAGKT